MPGETAWAAELSAVDRVYASAATAGFGLLWLGARALGTSAEGLRCRRGVLPQARGPLVWFHGASAGEMTAAAVLASLLEQHGYRFTAAYTAANRPGVELAARAGGVDSIAALAPWDHPRWVAEAFDRWRPRALFLVETELWPSLILEACRRGVPVFCVSGRIYRRDFPRYRLLRSLTAPMLRRVTAVLAQNTIERERFIALGADPERCTVAGNLKYAGVTGVRSGGSCGRRELALRNDEQVLVFGSIHADEVRSIFAALDHLPTMGLRAMIAPRHNSAATAVVREARRRSWRVHRRSAGRPPSNWQIFVLDRMGELSAAYAIASMAVVGGGFARHGGHNPFEPVMMGAPVVIGPHFDHFEHEARALTDLAAATRVSAGALGPRLAQWWTDSGVRQHVLELQRRAIPDGTAIAQRYVEALSPWLAVAKLH